jgi:hypothetical protein
MEEKFLYHELEANLELRQPWGFLDFRLEGFHFLHDFERSRLDLYSVELGGFMNVRLVRGLSLRMGGEISRIRDQVFLAAEETSEEEILLRSRRLPTSYDFEVSIGLNYTFGSIYNNIVNPRFGF